mgnify:FL=1|jgi:transcriptional regulator with XRE-family HTH domain
MTSFDTLSADAAANVLRSYTTLVNEEEKVTVEIDGRVRTVDTRPIYSFEREILDDVIQVSIDGFLTGAAIPVKGRWIHGWLARKGDEGDYINNVWHGYQYFLRYLQAETEDIQNMGTFNKSPGTYDSMYRTILMLEDLNLLLRFKEVNVELDEYDFFVPENIRKRTYIRVRKSYEDNEDLWNNPIEALYGDDPVEIADEDIEEDDEIDEDELDETGLRKINATKQALTEEQERKVVYLYNERDYTQRELAEGFGVSQATVSNVINKHSQMDTELLDDYLSTIYDGKQIEMPNEVADEDVDEIGDLTEDNELDEDIQDGITEAPTFDLPDPASILDFREEVKQQFEPNAVFPQFIEEYFDDAVADALDSDIVGIADDDYSLDNNVEDVIYTPNVFSLEQIAVVGDWADGAAEPGETPLTLFIGIKNNSDGLDLGSIPPQVGQSLKNILENNNYFIDAFDGYDVNVVYSSAHNTNVKDYVEFEKQSNQFYDYRGLELIDLSD